jgi:energy-coupling factor transport system ATP-binding protein
MIEVSDLRFRYSPDSPDVLNGISITIAQGSFTVIMGSNGSGKSTLARCLNGLLVPTAGAVRVDGAKTEAVARQELRRKVGLVFQDPNFQMTSLTVEREIAFGLENIGIMHDEMRASVDEYVQMFGFEKPPGRPSLIAFGRREAATCDCLGHDSPAIVSCS